MLGSLKNSLVLIILACRALCPRPQNLCGGADPRDSGWAEGGGVGRLQDTQLGGEWRCPVQGRLLLFQSLAQGGPGSGDPPAEVLLGRSEFR